MSTIYENDGYCHVCNSDTRFVARLVWLRDHLKCENCGSIPRERALALVLARHFPAWRSLVIHESSAGARGISSRLKNECLRYLPSQFFPGHESGELVRGIRNENLESQSFDAESLDLVITQDVFEHVNRPDEGSREIARTLKQGGAHIFTAPTYKANVTSERRARYRSDGSVEHFAPPEFHGNPVSDEGALVTFHYGYDLPALIHQWCGMDTEVVRFHDHHHGIIGEFTEVYISTKRTS